MNALSRSTLATRFMLMWFVLAMGVAIISPIVHPKNIELICSSVGVVKLIEQGDDAQGNTDTLDCPACLVGMAPVISFELRLTQSFPLAYAMQSMVAAHIASVTAPPLPSRGPPLISL